MKLSWMGSVELEIPLPLFLRQNSIGCFRSSMHYYILLTPSACGGGQAPISIFFSFFVEGRPVM